MTELLTRLPHRDDPAYDDSPPDRPRRVGSRTADDYLSLAGAAVGSLALTWLVFEQVLPFSGTVGFIVVWYLTFIGLYSALTVVSQPLTVVRDRIMSAVVQGLAALAAIAVVTTIVYVFWKGHPAYLHTNFFTQDLRYTAPTAPLNKGGIDHAIVGSAVEIAIAVGIALPLGLTTAVFLAEVGGRYARVVRTVVEAMTALPDLIAGLFIYAILVRPPFGFGPNGLDAALALSITMTPIIARSSEVVLRVVPGGLREAGLALGAGQLSTLWRVVLPTARPGLATSLILGIARGLGETAPLLIVAGVTADFNPNPLSGPMMSLPLFVYLGARSGEVNYQTRAYGAASVLLVIVLLLFIAVRFLARQRPRQR